MKWLLAGTRTIQPNTEVLKYLKVDIILGSLYHPTMLVRISPWFLVCGSISLNGNSSGLSPHHDKVNIKTMRWTEELNTSLGKVLMSETRRAAIFPNFLQMLPPFLPLLGLGEYWSLNFVTRSNSLGSGKVMMLMKSRIEKEKLFFSIFSHYVRLCWFRQFPHLPSWYEEQSGFPKSSYLCHDK